MGLLFAGRLQLLPNSGVVVFLADDSLRGENKKSGSCIEILRQNCQQTRNNGQSVQLIRAKQAKKSRICCAVLALSLCATALVGAAHAQEQEDFTFRRIGVADAQAGSRITVQVDPVEQARRLGLHAQPSQTSEQPLANAVPSVAPGAQYAWFWEQVPSAIEATSGRFLLAMSAVNTPPSGQSIRAPRVQALQDIAAEYGTPILLASAGTRVSPALALAVISVESAGRVDAVSGAGAQGLMQLIPATAERFGVTDSHDPAQNIAGGIAYLDWLMTEFDNDIVLALAGYNAGEGAVRRNSGVPPYAETRDYVPKVLAAWAVARGLCSTAPELPTDGCVFRINQTG
jgi:soluble lytic murein transglycosylase-like protein